MMRGKHPIEADAIRKILDGRRKRRMTVYTGDYVDISLDHKEYKNYRRSSMLLISVITFLHIWAGFLDNPAMYSFLVSLPYVAALCSFLFFIVVLFQLPKEKDKFRLGEVQLLFKRMRLASIILGISLGLGIVGELFFIYGDSAGDQLTLELNYLTLEVIAVFVAYFLIRTQIRTEKKIRVE
jgi:hypothetical protein